MGSSWKHEGIDIDLKGENMALPIMRKATAVWLVDNTTLTFQQIADFCGLHELEVHGIADGEVAAGVKGFDPVVNNQLTAEEIERCEADPKAKLQLKAIPNSEGERKRRGPRYTPLSRRQDRPAAIAWLVKNHPELSDGQISKLVGTTKPTINAIRTRTHWNIANIVPVDPVALGISSQMELDDAIQKAVKKHGLTENKAGLGETIVSTEESLATSDGKYAEFEAFTLGSGPAESEDASDDTQDDDIDPDSFFNLPE